MIVVVLSASQNTRCCTCADCEMVSAIPVAKDGVLHTPSSGYSLIMHLKLAFITKAVLWESKNVRQFKTWGTCLLMNYIFPRPFGIYRDILSINIV